MRKLLALPLALAAVFAGGATRIVQDQCGPFTDVTPAFCPYILELYYLGITVGTSATTYSPDDALTRGQGGVHREGTEPVARALSARAALGQWWTTTPHCDVGLGVATVGHTRSAPPRTARTSGSRTRLTARRLGYVRPTGRLIDTWTDVTSDRRSRRDGPRLRDRSDFRPSLHDRSEPAARAPSRPWRATLGTSRSASRSTALGSGSRTIGGSVSIVTPGPPLPWAITTVTTGFATPDGVLFDGTNVWITDYRLGEPASARLRAGRHSDGAGRAGPVHSRLRRRPTSGYPTATTTASPSCGPRREKS